MNRVPRVLGSDLFASDTLTDKYYVTQSLLGLLGADVENFCLLGFMARAGELRDEFQLATVLKAFARNPVRNTAGTITGYSIEDVK